MVDLSNVQTVPKAGSIGSHQPSRVGRWSQVLVDVSCRAPYMRNLSRDRLMLSTWRGADNAFTRRLRYSLRKSSRGVSVGNRQRRGDLFLDPRLAMETSLRHRDLGSYTVGSGATAIKTVATWNVDPHRSIGQAICATRLNQCAAILCSPYTQRSRALNRVSLFLCALTTMAPASLFT